MIVASLALTPAVCPHDLGAELFQTVDSLDGYSSSKICTTEDSEGHEQGPSGDCAWSALSGLSIVAAVDFAVAPILLDSTVVIGQQAKVQVLQPQRKLGRAPPLHS